MQICNTIPALRQLLDEYRKKGKSIGLVPTMGALHSGHISLIEKAKSGNDVAVCSIYINPTQFNNQEDFEMYPQTVEKDCELLKPAGCDVVFVPSHEEMYPGGFHNDLTKLDFGSISEELEGKFRPGHFNGVGIVVSKLLNIVNPDKAFFGQKDLQQFLIINKLVKDFSFGVELVCCPIIREKDGLAMSSRNSRLSQEERNEASLLFKVLSQAKEKLIFGEDVNVVGNEAKEKIASNKFFKLEYFEIVDIKSLKPIHQIKGLEDIALFVSAYLGKARLIDNILINATKCSDN
ncbi:MAG: pantoate--beta-alanine ligase [Flammeovirgaceae bacterium]|nr:pantoate--beta-alanine ligase [Flammeovirgaceae bacterium]